MLDIDFHGAWLLCTYIYTHTHTHILCLFRCNSFCTKLNIILHLHTMVGKKKKKNLKNNAAKNNTTESLLEEVSCSWYIHPLPAIYIFPSQCLFVLVFIPYLHVNSLVCHCNLMIFFSLFPSLSRFFVAYFAAHVLYFFVLFENHFSLKKNNFFLEENVRSLVILLIEMTTQPYFVIICFIRSQYNRLQPALYLLNSMAFENCEAYFQVYCLIFVVWLDGCVMRIFNDIYFHQH